MNAQASPPRPTRERRARSPRANERRELVRNALIESRLTPNAISLTGLALNIVAAALVWERYFFLGGVAFIVGSIMDTFDGRYSRMSGKGTPFGAFLDSTLDRLEEGIVLTAVGATFARQHANSPRRRSSLPCSPRSWCPTRAHEPRRLVSSARSGSRRGPSAS